MICRKICPPIANISTFLNACRIRKIFPERSSTGHVYLRFFVVLIAIPCPVYYNIKDYKMITKVPDMENIDSVWNKITELLGSLGFPDMSKSEITLVLLAVFLALLFILWIVFRKLRLWYWKTNIQIDTLKSIDAHLQNVEEKFSQNQFRTIETSKSELPVSNERELEPETVQKEAAPEAEGLTAVGRSGKLYTEAELELQIRD